MQRVNFKMVKDGNRTVIQIIGPSPQSDELALRILKAYCGYEDSDAANRESLSEDVVEHTCHLEAPAFEQDETLDEETIDALPDYQEIANETSNRISSGAYIGMTATEALQRDKGKALGALFVYAKNIPDSFEKQDIIKSCRYFMSCLPMTREEYPTRDDKVDFIQDVAKMMQIAPFINGYTDLTSFCNYASDAEVEATFIAVTQTLQDRSLKSKPSVV